MGRAGVPGRHPDSLRRAAAARGGAHRHRHRAAARADGGDAVTHTILNLWGPLGVELGVGALLVVVLLLGLFRPAIPDRRCGWVSLAGLVALSVWAFMLRPGGSLFDGAYVLDPLALFAQRLFLVSAAVSVLAT